MNNKKYYEKLLKRATHYLSSPDKDGLGLTLHETSKQLKKDGFTKSIKKDSLSRMMKRAGIVLPRAKYHKNSSRKWDMIELPDHRWKKIGALNKEIDSLKQLTQTQSIKDKTTNLEKQMEELFWMTPSQLKDELGEENKSKLYYVDELTYNNRNKAVSNKIWNDDYFEHIAPIWHSPKTGYLSPRGKASGSKYLPTGEYKILTYTHIVGYNFNGNWLRLIKLDKDRNPIKLIALEPAKVPMLREALREIPPAYLFKKDKQYILKIKTFEVPDKRKWRFEEVSIEKLA